MAEASYLSRAGSARLRSPLTVQYFTVKDQTTKSCHQSDEASTQATINKSNDGRSLEKSTINKARNEWSQSQWDGQIDTFR